ncbi:MAG: flippase-like domain-containing protein [Verrucomicrobia bacterium]|nr:flippase-like domain-containing protein [Verrucomicrobiota bacterium]
MKPASAWLKSLVQLALCGLLLAWIFQAIFWKEGQDAWERDQRAPAWKQLTKLQRLEISWTHGPREVWRDMSRVRPGPFAVSLALMGATIFLGIVRWRQVLRVHGLELSFARAAEISLVAHFFNSFLLGAAGGDLMKAYYAARETHHKKAEAVGTVFVDRILGLFALLVFTMAAMAANVPLLSADPFFLKLASVIAAMFAGCAVVLLLALRGGVSKGLPQAREWLRRLPKGDFLERLRDSLKPFGHDRAFLVRSFSLSLLLCGVCVLHVQSLVWGLGLEISSRHLFAIVPMITCMVVLPLTPSGLGVRENLFVLMLAVPLIGVEHTAALSLSLLCTAGSLFWSLIGGAVYVGLRSRHRLDDLSRAEAASE